MLHHAAVQGARGSAARRLRVRDKRERVLGRSAESLYRWVWPGRTACVAGRPLGPMLSRWVARPCEGISNQLRSAGAALQRLLQIPSELLTDALGAQQPLGLHQPAGLLRLCGGRSRRHLGCAGGLLLGCHSPTRAARYVGRRGATTPWLCVPVRI